MCTRRGCTARSWSSHDETARSVELSKRPVRSLMNIAWTTTSRRPDDRLERDACRVDPPHQRRVARVEFHVALVQPAQRVAHGRHSRGARVREHRQRDARRDLVAGAAQGVDDGGEVGVQGGLAVAGQREAVDGLGRGRQRGECARGGARDGPGRGPRAGRRRAVGRRGGPAVLAVAAIEGADLLLTGKDVEAERAAQPARANGAVHEPLLQWQHRRTPEMPGFRKRGDGLSRERRRTREEPPGAGA